MLCVGALVEARWGGGQKGYLGTITTVNADGTFQITYTEDGDVEDEVPEELISLVQQTKTGRSKRKRSSTRSKEPPGADGAPQFASGKQQKKTPAAQNTQTKPVAARDKPAAQKTTTTPKQSPTQTPKPLPHIDVITSPSPQPPPPPLPPPPQQVTPLPQAPILAPAPTLPLPPPPLALPPPLAPPPPLPPPPTISAPPPSPSLPQLPQASTGSPTPAAAPLPLLVLPPAPQPLVVAPAPASAPLTSSPTAAAPMPTATAVLTARDPNVLAPKVRPTKNPRGRKGKAGWNAGDRPLQKNSLSNKKRNGTATLFKKAAELEGATDGQYRCYVVVIDTTSAADPSKCGDRNREGPTPTMHIYASGVDAAQNGERAARAANKIGTIVKKYANLQVRNDRKSKWQKGKRTAKVYGLDAARRSPAASAQLALRSFVASQEHEDDEELPEIEDTLDDVLASVPVFGNAKGGGAGGV